MFKINKLNLLVFAVFTFSTQIINAGFKPAVSSDYKTDMEYIQVEIEKFEQSYTFLSNFFKELDQEEDFTTSLLISFGDQKLYKQIEKNLLNIKNTLNSINTTLDKILSENLTTPEILDLTFFKFPQLSQKLNEIFQEAYKTFSLAPCYKTFSLLETNIDKSKEEIFLRYELYINNVSTSGIWAYNVSNKIQYIFANFALNTCLFTDQNDLFESIKNYPRYTSMPCIGPETMNYYDNIFSIKNNEISTPEALSQKINDCLSHRPDFCDYNYLAIPENQSLWPCMFDTILEFLKQSTSENSEMFPIALENLLCDLYLKTPNPTKYVDCTFNPSFKGEKYKFPQKTYKLIIFPIFDKTTTLVSFLENLIEYLDQKKLLKDNIGERLLVLVMYWQEHKYLVQGKNLYELKNHKPTKGKKDYRIISLKHIPTKLKRSFSQAF